MELATENKRDFETRSFIAREILAQLGGQNRLVLMTGAKNFALTDLGVSFRLPRYKHPNWVNYIAIDLMWDDTYTIRAGRIRSTDYTETVKVESVYCDILRETIEKITGLKLSL